MPGDRTETLESLLSQYATTAQEYSNSISELSDAIVAVEDVLCSLPGKIEASVPINECVVLSFSRTASSWSLNLVNSDGSTLSRLRDAPIDLKIMAYPCLESLIKNMMGTQANRLQSLRDSVPDVTQLDTRIAQLKSMVPTENKEARHDVSF